jgi:hypothetical protein
MPIFVLMMLAPFLLGSVILALTFVVILFTTGRMPFLCSVFEHKWVDDPYLNYCDRCLILKSEYKVDKQENLK